MMAITELIQLPWILKQKEHPFLTFHIKRSIILLSNVTEMATSTNDPLANIAFDYEITQTAAPYISALGLILLGFYLFRDKGTKLPYLNPKNRLNCPIK